MGVSYPKQHVEDANFGDGREVQLGIVTAREHKDGEVSE